MQQDWTANTAGPRPGSSRAQPNSGFTPQELKARQQMRDRRKVGLARKEQVNFLTEPILSASKISHGRVVALATYAIVASSDLTIKNFITAGVCMVMVESPQVAWFVWPGEGCCG